MSAPADGYPPEFLKFLGTAGARFVVSKQTRASGGLWVRLAGRTLLVDPGPGALVKVREAQPSLDPERLDAILVSHKHLDHTNDVNVMIEAMTQGGHQPRGVLLGPSDAIDGDSPICQYVLRYIGEVVRIAEGGEYRIGDLRVRVAARHDHPDHTYGFLLEGGREVVGLVTDTRFSEDLARHYAGAQVLVVNAVLADNPNRRIYHLSAAEAEGIIAQVKPRLAVLTHFGMRMLEAGPERIAAEMTERTGVRVIAAEDGMVVRIGG